MQVTTFLIHTFPSIYWWLFYFILSQHINKNFNTFVNEIKTIRLWELTDTRTLFPWPLIRESNKQTLHILDTNEPVNDDVSGCDRLNPSERKNNFKQVAATFIIVYIYFARADILNFLQQEVIYFARFDSWTRKPFLITITIFDCWTRKLFLITITAPTCKPRISHILSSAFLLRIDYLSWSTSLTCVNYLLYRLYN